MKNIIDLGCGEKCNEEATILVDKNTSFLKNRWGNKKLIDFDLESNKRLPFSDYTIDKVYCHDVFEHLLCCHTCLLMDIHRILRIGGQLELKVPNSYFITHRLRHLFGIIQHDITLSHHHHFHPQEIIGLFSRAGYKLNTKRNWQLFLIPAIFLPHIKVIGGKQE